MARKDIAGKECAVIACCEEEDMSVMDGVCVPLERSAALLKWKMVGEVLVPGVLKAGGVEKPDGCAQAAGRSSSRKALHIKSRDSGNTESRVITR